MKLGSIYSTTLFLFSFMLDMLGFLYFSIKFSIKFVSIYKTVYLDFDGIALNPYILSWVVLIVYFHICVLRPILNDFLFKKMSYNLFISRTWSVIHSLDPDRNSNVPKVTKNILNKSICGRKKPFLFCFVFDLYSAIA